MECSTEVVVFVCAYKRGVAVPNEIQNDGHIQKRLQTSCTTSQRILNGHNAEYIPGITDEYNV